MVMPTVAVVGRGRSYRLGIQEEMRWIRPVPDSDDSPELELRFVGLIRRRLPAETAELARRNRRSTGEQSPGVLAGARESWRRVEPELRLSIIDELSGLGARPGAEMLLRLLSSARDPATRTAAIAALERIDGDGTRACSDSRRPPSTDVDREAGGGRWDAADERSSARAGGRPNDRGRGWLAAWSRRSTARAEARSSSRSTRATSAGPPRSCATCGSEFATSWAKSSPSRPGPAV